MAVERGLDPDRSRHLTEAVAVKSFKKYLKM
jgi:hypothetical protein